MSKSRYIQENRQLAHQLELANMELAAIKGSRAFNAARVLGKIKNELVKSPVGFTKKAVKKILSGGSILSGVENAGHRISNTANIATQYKSWIALNEPDEVELNEQAKKSASFKNRPLISIVTPVFNPPKQVFIDLIESVLAQTYPNFELCLGNFGDDEEVVRVIEQYAAKDDRIKNMPFDENKGIAANSNMILKHAKGDYIALLDHDDTLSPDALYENVKAINETGADFLFSDKDKIDEEGNRFDPFFKPRWSPEIMLNANYLTHLNVMKRSLVDKVGAWSSDTDGAQDWDLFLKLVSATDKIVHIPKVLYHWRVIATSTAMSIETKPYALKGQRVAVDRYMAIKKIPAESYHIGAELLLKWHIKPQTISLYVVSTTPSRTLEFIDGIPEGLRSALTIITDSPLTRNGLKVLQVTDVNSLTVISSAIEKQASEHFAIISDRLDPAQLSEESIQHLSGWLTVPGVAGVSPRITDPKNGRTIDCGAIITPVGLIPTFRNAAPYQQDPGGNVEWVKDVDAGSALFFVSKKQNIRELKKQKVGLQHAALLLQLHVSSNGGRIVHDPKVIFALLPKVEYDAETDYNYITDEHLDSLKPDWKYYNPNLNPENIGSIITVTQNESLSIDENLADLPSPYSAEALAHAQNYEIDDNDIEASNSAMSEAISRPLPDKPSFMFILPGFTGIYAGLNNIFSFAEHMAQKGSSVHFAFMIDANQVSSHRKMIEKKYPVLANARFSDVNMHSVASLPRVDVAVCTQWATAYVLLKYNNCSRKCYFIQDKEASFYPKGSISALVDNTYSFGFYALANTPGLLEWYESEYGGIGTTIKSKVDLDVYALPETLNVKPKAPYKVFFYGRPGEPRNAFELGVGALALLKKHFKDDIEIYSAGAAWSPAVYGLDGVVENLGKISYEKLPSFYRSMDAGLMFMFSGHPGVVASELMASGCPVVVNAYDDETWRTLYRHEESALVSLPTTKAVYESLERVLTDSVLRQRLITGAQKTVSEFYMGYEESCDFALNALAQSEAKVLLEK